MHNYTTLWIHFFDKRNCIPIVFSGVCKTIFNDCTDSMFEELVKEWFKHGKQRYFRENKNNNVTSSLNATM